MLQKLIQIGNSTGIIIPNSLLNELNLKEGNQVIIEKDESGKFLTVANKNVIRKKARFSPRFSAILEKVNKQYGQALRQLAEQKD